MLYDPLTDPGLKKTLTQAISINWGLPEVEKLRQKKVVYLFGIMPEWVQQRFINNPRQGRVLDFTLLSFASPHPELDSPFFKSDLTQYYNFYSVSEHFVDCMVNMRDYYEMLDAIAETLQSQDYLVLKILKKPDSYEPAFAKELGLKILLETPNFVDSFVGTVSKNYLPLDSIPESWLTTAGRMSFNFGDY